MEDITLDGMSVTSDPSVFQRGKGIIVDSGTTDTYLPKSVAKGFSQAWKAATGSVRATAAGNGRERARGVFFFFLSIIVIPRELFLCGFVRFITSPSPLPVDKYCMLPSS